MPEGIGLEEASEARVVIASAEVVEAGFDVIAIADIAEPREECRSGGAVGKWLAGATGKILGQVDLLI